MRTYSFCLSLFFGYIPRVRLNLISRLNERRTFIAIDSQACRYSQILIKYHKMQVFVGRFKLIDYVIENGIQENDVTCEQYWIAIWPTTTSNSMLLILSLFRNLSHFFPIKMSSNRLYPFPLFLEFPFFAFLIVVSFFCFRRSAWLPLCHDRISCFFRCFFFFI